MTDEELIARLRDEAVAHGLGPERDLRFAAAAALARLRGERDEARADFHARDGALVHLKADLAGVRAQHAQAVEALRKYGRHTSGCPAIAPYVVHGTFACACGLDAARATLKQAE